MVAIDVTKEDLETLFTRIHLTGLAGGSTRYDVFRLQMRYLGKDDTGARKYERELPDRRGLWSTVAHRVGWDPGGTSAFFRDFECPRRPTVYYVCASSAGGPHEWDFEDGNYPVSRGVLDSEVVHFGQDFRDAFAEQPDEGHIMFRSTAELALYESACLVEMDGPKYLARGTEHQVMRSQFPVYISDTRESRRGSVTVLTRSLGQYNRLRRICYPASGRIRPVMLHGGGDRTLLLDDMRIIPLDVTIEQTVQSDADMRYVTIDYVEVDPTFPPLVHRIGDNDDLVSEPQANFTISDPTPGVGDWVTLTDTSTGLGDDWHWTIERGNETDNKVGEFYTAGPHRIRWHVRGRKTVKLRFGGSGAGHHTRTKYIDVHG